MPLIQRNFETITRLDLAADLETGVTPAEFVAAGYSARIRTSGADDSETGSTRYVGSEKSAKFARVYRYYDPHPRSKFLRVEVVLRDEYAKSAAQMLLTQSVAEVYWASTASLSFKHPTWRRPDEFAEAKLTLPNERKNANRLRWLEKQIRPVIVEAHKTGLIDVLDWLGLRQ